jgi:DHA3 family tetracycline resistance protein-like MFS transporter
LNLFKSLTHRPFALLLSGQTTSRLGDSLFRITLAWWVLEKTHSATAMGTVLIFSSVPMLIFLLIGGVATDRFPRLLIMLFSDLLNGIVVTAITLMAFFGWLEVWHIYIASVIFGLVSAFFHPAYTATVPEITPKVLLSSANSLTSLFQRGTSIIGPAIGASIVAFGGTPLAFGLDALSFGISAVCILLILRSNPELNAAPKPPIPAEVNVSIPPAKAGMRSAFRDLRDGYLAVIASPWLWITIVIFGFVNSTSSPMSVSLPFLIKNNLHAEVEVLGLFTSMSAAGFVLGAVFIGSFKNIRRRGPLAYLATIAYGVAIGLFGLTISIPVLAVVAFIGGFCISIFGLIWTNSLQELVPRKLLGRVSSIDALGSYVLLPIGYGISGWATDQIGAPLVFLIGGGLTVLLTLIGLSNRAIRGLD